MVSAHAVRNTVVGVPLTLEYRTPIRQSDSRTKKNYCINNSKNCTLFIIIKSDEYIRNTNTLGKKDK